MKVLVPYGYNAIAEHRIRHSHIHCVVPDIALEDAPIALIYKDQNAHKNAEPAEIRIIDGAPYQIASDSRNGKIYSAKPNSDFQISPGLFTHSLNQAAIDIHTSTLSTSRESDHFARADEAILASKSGKSRAYDKERNEIESRVREFCASDLRFVDGNLYIKTTMPVFVVKSYYSRTKLELSLSRTKIDMVQNKDWLRTFPITDFDAAFAERQRMASVIEAGGEQCVCVTPMAEGDIRIVDESLCRAATAIAPQLLDAALDAANSAFAAWLPFAKSEDVIDLYDDLRCRVAQIDEPNALNSDSSDDIALLARAREMLSKSVETVDPTWAGLNNRDAWAERWTWTAAEIFKEHARKEEKARALASVDLALVIERLNSMASDAQLINLSI